MAFTMESHANCAADEIKNKAAHDLGLRVVLCTDVGEYVAFYDEDFNDRIMTLRARCDDDIDAFMTAYEAGIDRGKEMKASEIREVLGC